MTMPPDSAAIDITACNVELWRYRLDRPIGGSGVASIDVLVVELESRLHRAMGFSYVLGGPGKLALRAARTMVAEHVEGRRLGHPAALWRQVVTGLGHAGSGPHITALAALDVAVWDLYARHLGQPLGVAMGGADRSMPVYGSGLFNASQSPEAAAEAATIQFDRGFLAVKPRVKGASSDRALLEAVAAVAPPDASLMIDANEKCDLPSAIRLCGLAEDLGVLFVEEPLPARHVLGYRTLAAKARTAIAMGEHLAGVDAAQPFIADRLCSVFQPDLAMMGGLTPCLRAAQFAEHHNIVVAPHFLPRLFVHLAAAAPNVRWLEDFPTLEPLMDPGPAVGLPSLMSLPAEPGHGLAWVDGAREAWRLSDQELD